jgi:uncharacterized protein (DUF1778 family)
MGPLARDNNETTIVVEMDRAALETIEAAAALLGVAPEAFVLDIALTKSATIIARHEASELGREASDAQSGVAPADRATKLSPRL